jgi:hypothetical protein
MSVQPSFVPKPATGHGPSSSEEFNDMVAAILKDVSALATQANTNETSIENVGKLLFQEFMNARNTSAARIEDIRRANYLAAVRGEDIDNFVSFRFFRGPEYYLTYEGIAAERKARVEPIYGQALLPYNNVVNRMYAVDPETGDPILADGVDAVVTGEGEEGATVTEGDPLKAFNGQNREYWVRKVAFPLEHDVSDVAAEIEVSTPDVFAGQANMLTIHPYPLGQLDVEEILYSVDASDPSLTLTGFTLIRGAGFTRWVFPTLGITKLKIKFRQRNFVEEDGKKVFYLGAQEIGLQLVEFDQTAGEVQRTNNNSVVAVLEAPDGYFFGQLKRLFTLPDYATALDETGIRLYIFTDEDLTAQVWSSYDDPRLEDTPVDVSGGSFEKLYILVNLQYLDTGITPLLDDIVITYDLTTGPP